MPEFPTTAVFPQPPQIPIKSADTSWKNGYDPTRPLGKPILNFPYLVVKNVMFFVEKELNQAIELAGIEMGTRYSPAPASTFLPFMTEAVLCHVEPVVEEAKRNVYRFYYMVPPEQQWKYNIQEMKKIMDGYTLMTTASDGLFYNQDTDPQQAKWKMFYEIQREWVEPLSTAYAPLALGTFDPSNDVLTPNFEDNHTWTGYDAQLVYEEVGRFEEDHLNKIFRKVIRVYKTLPGPVVKEMVPYNFWMKGDTVWEVGGPDTLLPESEWKAQIGVKLTREVWAAPLWSDQQGGTVPHKARRPYMPQYELPEQPYQEGWDKASYPSLQNYVWITMYRRYNNLTLNEDQNSLSGNCCNPDGRFTRCINTTITTSQSIDWTANGDIPAVNPPDPAEQCSEWRVDASVVVREGHSVKETRKSCTTYDMIDEFWESQLDSQTNTVFPVLRKLVHNPSTDFETDWQAEGFTKVGSGADAYYVRNSDGATGYVTRQWVNPCYAVDSFIQFPGLGYYRMYTTVQNYSFPMVLRLDLDVDYGFHIIDSRPDKSGKYTTKWFPWFYVNKNSYSGPCKAVVEEWYSPTRVAPTGWGEGVDVQFITNSVSFQNPKFGLEIPASLHPSTAIQATNGTEDAEWTEFDVTYNIRGTKYTDWEPVTTYQVSPNNGGYMYRKTTIYPPED